MMTTLADGIEALAKAYSSLSLSASNERVYDTAISIANCVQDNLPTILRALRERDQAVEALRVYAAWGGKTATRTLARIEGAEHE